ncbi:MAG: PIG-L family deacetylase [Actinomycetota bacterium]
MDSRRRLMLVHAHPDDETLSTGLTMARAVADGVQVTLVTCTLGELGEVVADDLREFDPRHGGLLGPRRAVELADAMRTLGVTDHRLLGDGRWHDSGMSVVNGVIHADPHAPPNAFSFAEVDEPARALAAILAEVRPHVVVTYDPGGGYGHPDHVMAHQVTMRAVELIPAEERPLVHWIVVARSWVDDAQDAHAEHAEDHIEEERADAGLGGSQRPPGMTGPGQWAPSGVSAVVDDHEVDIVITGSPQDQEKVAAALAAHRTQLIAPHPVQQREGFRRVSGPQIPDDRKPVPDLFADGL